MDALSGNCDGERDLVFMLRPPVFTLADAVVLHAGSGSFRRGTRSTRYRKGLNKCRSCLETCQERCCGLILRNWACAY